MNIMSTKEAIDPHLEDATTSLDFAENHSPEISMFLELTSPKLTGHVGAWSDRATTWTTLAMGEA